jgi:hypothetical protein
MKTKTKVKAGGGDSCGCGSNSIVGQIGLINLNNVLNGNQVNLLSFGNFNGGN